MDPTIIIGGRVDSLGGGNAKLGHGEFLIAEADESDKSFLTLPAAVVVVTNIDNDHMDNYHTMDALKNAFVEFINRIPFYGLAIVCVDDENVRSILPKINKPYITYGFSEDAQLRATKVQASEFGSEYTLSKDGKELGTVCCGVPGEHNVLNSVASLAVGMEVGLSFADAAKGLGQFTGVKRRMERKGEADGVIVIDDYAHHPTELRATIGALKDSHNGRLVALFQPHRYSRTRDCYSEFLQSLQGVDQLFLADIFPAGEDPIPSISSEKMVKDLKANGFASVHFAGGVDVAAKAIQKHLKKGDMFVTLGAGNVYRVGEELLQDLQ